MRPIRGVLLDIDGVLHVSMQPLPGAAEVLRWLEVQGYATCFVSNTTTMARATLARQLQRIGLPVSEQRMVTAPVAAAQYIRQHFPGKRCWLLTKGDTAADFAGIELVEHDAEVVVIGGAEELLTYEAMNEAFRCIMAGAPLLALHKNMYWKTKHGLQLDSGPFVRALEIASGKEAIVLGKPTAAFFEQALRAIGCAANETVMVGDDIENDVGGAQKDGLRGILVCTGKHRADSPLLEHVQPEAILPALADLPQWLQKQS
ncbi:TIGR01458 family HAD-type hydrolase [Dictyobacter aurantiacus]|uniref:Haloacid dehalogenase-like hydrolase domain-containing protein 2 n=1 Tax=Dictyobacter aurantiacus TaxID=1936993 RepID=A0A401ZJ70_9CHLR|nr:TIGR01458 family HAD-type hydrolase [Dictyobacter aurantiacus]GCE06890.1 putative HAD-superfamily hydrolase [Dictyobacter aurantiacus]